MGGYDLHVQKTNTLHAQVFLGSIVGFERHGPSVITFIYADGRHVSLLANDDTWEIAEEHIPQA